MRVQCPNGHLLDVPPSASHPASPLRQAEVPHHDTPPGGIEERNPYGSPVYTSDTRNTSRAALQLRVTLPAIFLIVTGLLGAGFACLNVVVALTGEPPPPNPDLPEFLRGLEAGAFGPVAAVFSACFVAVNGAIALGGVQMIRFKTWGLALTASILAIINFHTCCCFLGLPVGVWSLVILSQQNVRAAFAQVSADGRW
jgi:hypothetical protein